MDRIYLTKDEKKVLKDLVDGANIESIKGLSKLAIGVAVDGLESKKLAKGWRNEAGRSISAILADSGRLYVERYPRLKNPIKWQMIGAFILGTVTVLGILWGIVCK